MFRALMTGLGEGAWRGCGSQVGMAATRLSPKGLEGMREHVGALSMRSMWIGLGWARLFRATIGLGDGL